MTDLADLCVLRHREHHCAWFQPLGNVHRERLLEDTVIFCLGVDAQCGQQTRGPLLYRYVSRCRDSAFRGSPAPLEGQCWV